MPIIDKVSLERTRSGYQWTDSDDGVAIRFAGKPATDAPDSSSTPATRGVRSVAARQVHSASIKKVPPRVSITPADALVTSEPRTTLSVVTADCVPLLAFDGRTAVAIHAGWRGIAASIVPRALARLSRDRTWRVWVGPHVGPCCYEVDQDVARQVVDASSREAVVGNGGGKAHLDLRAAVMLQMSARPDDRITIVEECTRCSPESLWSYRRDGPGAGRNTAEIELVDGG